MEQKPDIWAGVRRLLGSSKALVVLLAIIGVVVMQLSGKIESHRALDFIKWLVMTLVGATAVEDGAKKLGQRGE